MEKLKQNPIVKKLGLNRILLACILVLMFVVFKVVLGSKFPVGDSIKSTLNYVYFLGFLSLGVTFVIATGGIDFSCLLYTSDAADEEDSVDLGGCRIIKKKNKKTSKKRNRRIKKK